MNDTQALVNLGEDVANKSPIWSNGRMNWTERDSKHLFLFSD